MKRVLITFLLFYAFDLEAQIEDSMAIRQIDSLIILCRIHTDKREFEKALEFNSAAEKLAIENFSQESSVFGIILFHHGRVLFYKGNYKEAEKFYLQAKGIREKTVGKENSDYALNLSNLGQVYIQLGNYEKSEQFHIEAKGIREKIFGKENSEYVASLINLANVYLIISKYKEAELLYIEAREIRERIVGKDHPDYAQILINLALLYFNIGDYDRAEPFYIDAISIREKNFGKNNADYAWSLINLATLYLKIDQLEKAEVLFKEGIAIQEKVIGKENSKYAWSINNLGQLYYQLGKYDKAESLFQTAMNIRARVLGKDHPDYGGSLNNLSNFYFSTGNFSKVENLLLETKSIREKKLGRSHPSFALCLNNLANLYASKGDQENAVQLFMEAIAIQEKTLGRKHPDYAQSLHNLANVYLSKKNFNEAERLYIEANAIRFEAFSSESAEFAKGIKDLAGLYVKMRLYDKAEPLYRQALAIYEKYGKSHPDYARLLYKIIDLHWSIGNYSEIKKLLNEAVLIEESLLIKAGNYLSLGELNFYLNTFNESLNRIFSIAQSRDELHDACFDICLFYKGFVLQSINQFKLLSAADSALREKYNLLKSFERRLAAEYSKPNHSNIQELEFKSNEIEKELAQSIRGYTNSKQQANWKSVQQKLKKKEAAIEFLNYKYFYSDSKDSNKYVAIVLKDDNEMPNLIPLFEESQLYNLLHKNSKEDIKAIIDNLYLNSNHISIRSEGKIKVALFELIWKPLQNELKDIKTIYYSPSGLLHRLNLGAIAINDKEIISDKYNLIEMGSTRNLVVGNISSDSMALNDLNRVKTNDYAELYGGIEYDYDSTELFVGKSDAMESYAGRNATRGKEEELKFEYSDSMSRGGSWYYLKWTEKEVSSVESILKAKNIKSKIHKSYSATEESFKSIGVNNPSPRILHIATHGYFFADPKDNRQEAKSNRQEDPVFKISEHPMIRSGLILAGGNHAWKTGKPFKEGMEDGILTAYEISQMNLSNTDLVVLSACETGLGDIQGNEGVYGLQRAFKIAGAKYLIMSLWQVPDKQTKEFMEAFYKRWLNDKLSIPQAFRKAQKEMQEKFVEPYSWAGFVLVE